MARVARRPIVAKAMKQAGPAIVGDCVVVRLDSVKPNPWNPNEMTAFERSSLRHGLETDGWLKSMAMTVWGLDDKGVRQNIIIDGYHRWDEAPKAGYVEGPAVFLDGLNEAQAKALTVKLFQRRGQPNHDKLADLLQELQYSLDVPDLSLELGVDAEAMMVALREQEGGMEGGEAAPPEDERGSRKLSGKTKPMTQGEADAGDHIRMVQLFFTAAHHDEFQVIEAKLRAHFGVKATSDVVLEAMRRATSTTP